MSSQVFDTNLPLPNFFVVGAVKAGTTSLYAYLSQHPEVFMSMVKEPHFFSPFEFKHQFDNFVAPISDPREYQLLFQGSETYKAVGEASPSYLCDPHAPARINSSIVNAKIIMSLRNPVQRAYSHYLMEYHRGRETLPFQQALEADDARSEKGWGVSFQYVEIGLYANQVKRYFEMFGRDKVLVILFEDLVKEPNVVMGQVAKFLRVDPKGFPEAAFLRAHNAFEASRGSLARSILHSRNVRVWSRRLLPKKVRVMLRSRFLVKDDDRPALEDQVQGMLTERFASDLNQLESLLGKDLSKLRVNA